MTSPSQALPAVLDKIDADLDRSVERLFDFLRIESISTDMAYKDQCKAAAEFVAKDLSSIGFDASVRPTGGHPIVVGKAGGGGNGHGKAPHVLFYGHYDVQPVDPLDQWETPPFSPRIATLPDGRKAIVARGACDDKGQVMTFVEACRAYKAVTGSLPLPITMMIEGEEECGSKHLFGFVKDNADEFKLDLALVCDTSMWDPKTPMVTTSLRGLVYEQVNLTCADRDLHSGLFGGAAQNPIRVLARILADMHDKNGRVTIPGFYDGVKDLPKDIKADLAKLKLSPKDFLGPVGLKVPAGEKSRMLIEQIATRPTAEINGILGGYTGEGGEDRHPVPGDGEGVVPAGRQAEPGEDPQGVPRVRQSAVAGRLQGGVRQLRRRARNRTAVRQPGAGQDPLGVVDRVGQEGDRDRRGRFDPDRRRLQARARDGHRYGWIRTRRRSRPFAEREVRPDQFPQGYPFLGPHSGGVGGVAAAM